MHARETIIFCGGSRIEAELAALQQRQAQPASSSRYRAAVAHCLSCYHSVVTRALCMPVKCSSRWCRGSTRACMHHMMLVAGAAMIGMQASCLSATEAPRRCFRGGRAWPPHVAYHRRSVAATWRRVLRHCRGSTVFVKPLLTSATVAEYVEKRFVEMFYRC
jgi:hypothetical protein